MDSLFIEVLPDYKSLANNVFSSLKFDQIKRQELLLDASAKPLIYCVGPSTQEIASNTLEDLEHSLHLVKIVYRLAITFFAISLFFTIFTYQNSYQPFFQASCSSLAISSVFLYTAHESFSHFDNFDTVRYNIVEIKNSTTS